MKSATSTDSTKGGDAPPDALERIAAAMWDAQPEDCRPNWRDLDTEADAELRKEFLEMARIARQAALSETAPMTLLREWEALSESFDCRTDKGKAALASAVNDLGDKTREFFKAGSSSAVCVVVPREFIEGIEFGTWRRTDTREGYMCPRCSAFKREGHKPNCSWGGTIKELLSERDGG